MALSGAAFRGSQDGACAPDNRSRESRMSEATTDNAPNTARKGLPRWAVLACLLLLALLAVLRSHLGTRLDSFTIDEPWHIVAGASYVQTGDWRLNPEHPPLTKLWVGLFMPPSLLQLPSLPVLVDKAQERDFVERTTYVENDGIAIQQRARLAMWLFNASLLFALGLLAWRLFGPVAAAALLGLAALEPTLSAHLPLVMTDLPLALTLMLAALCAGGLAQRWCWGWALLTGIAMGLALASKHSALAGLLGLAIALAAVLLWQARDAGWRASLRRLAMLAIAGLIAVAVLWAHYGFRFHTSLDGSDPLNREMAAKVSDLNRPLHRDLIGRADANRLLPRPYLWGLADTVRAGVDGRGQTMHRLWGTVHKDGRPWHTWPSQIVSKLPLATLGMLLLAVALLMRTRLPIAQKLAVLMVLAMAGAHFAALAGSQGSYAGIRHALPVVMAMLLLIALAIAQALARLGDAPDRLATRAPVAAFAALLLALIIATLPEPRLYEFHNRLAGGSQDAWRYFDNESVQLGQRAHEARAFYEAVIVHQDLPFFGARSRQFEGAGVQGRYWVESLDDDNVEGVFEGYFLSTMSSLNPAPEFDWDPDTFYADTEQVHRAGHLLIRKGRIVDPRARARGIGARLYDYLYRDKGEDWDLVARRSEEVLQVDPFAIPVYLELGNARLRLGQREPALAAYRDLLEQTRFPVDAAILARLREHIARIEASEHLDGIDPMRNPWLE